MKLRFVLLGLALLALISACTPVTKEVYYICPDGTKVLDVNECKPVEKPQEPANTVTQPVEPNPAAQFSEEFQQLIAKNQKVKVMRFVYISTNYPYPDRIYVTDGTKIRIILQTKDRFDANNPFDTVYLDTSTKTSLAYCERASIQTCIDRNMNRRADYDDYIILTPFDWIEGMTKAELTGKTKMVEGRILHEATFASAGNEGTIYIDDFFGMPLEVHYGGVVYQYLGALFNEDKAEDLVHKTLSNV